MGAGYLHLCMNQEGGPRANRGSEDTEVGGLRGGGNLLRRTPRCGLVGAARGPGLGAHSSHRHEAACLPGQCHTLPGSPLQDPPYRPAPPAVPLSEADPFSRTPPLGLHSGNHLLSNLPPRMPPITIGQPPRNIDPALLKQCKQVRLAEL